MKRERERVRGYRLGLAIAIALAAALAPQAVAEIPTTALSADGGPPAPPPKAKAPRVEQRTSEQRPASSPSLG